MPAPAAASTIFLSLYGLSAVAGGPAPQAAEADVSRTEAQELLDQVASLSNESDSDLTFFEEILANFREDPAPGIYGEAYLVRVNEGVNLDLVDGAGQAAVLPSGTYAIVSEVGGAVPGALDGMLHVQTPYAVPLGSLSGPVDLSISNYRATDLSKVTVIERISDEFRNDALFGRWGSDAQAFVSMSIETVAPEGSPPVALFEGETRDGRKIIIGRMGGEGLYLESGIYAAGILSTEITAEALNGTFGEQMVLPTGSEVGCVGSFEDGGRQYLLCVSTAAPGRNFYVTADALRGQLHFVNPEGSRRLDSYFGLDSLSPVPAELLAAAYFGSVPEAVPEAVPEIIPPADTYQLVLNTKHQKPLAYSGSKITIGIAPLTTYRAGLGEEGIRTLPEAYAETGYGGDVIISKVYPESGQVVPEVWLGKGDDDASQINIILAGSPTQAQATAAAAYVKMLQDQGYSLPVEIDPALSHLSFEVGGYSVATAPAVSPPAVSPPAVSPPAPVGSGTSTLPYAGMLPGTTVFPVLPPEGVESGGVMLAVTTNEPGYHGRHIDIAPALWTLEGDYKIVAPGPGWTVTLAHDNASCVYIQDLGQYYTDKGVPIPDCSEDMEAGWQQEHPSLNVIFLEQDHGDGTKTVMRMLHIAKCSLADYVRPGYVTVGAEELAKMGNQGIMEGNSEANQLVQEDPAHYVPIYARHLHIDIHEEKYNSSTDKWEYYDAVIPAESLVMPYDQDGRFTYEEIRLAAQNAGMQWSEGKLVPLNPYLNPAESGSPAPTQAPVPVSPASVGLTTITVPNEPWLQNMTTERLLAMDPATLDFYGHGGLFDEAIGFRYVYGTLKNLDQFQQLLGPERLDYWYQLPEMAEIPSLTVPSASETGYSFVERIKQVNEQFSSFAEFEAALLDIDPRLTYGHFRQLCNDRGITTQLAATILMDEAWVGRYFRIVKGTDPSNEDPMQTDADSSVGYAAVIAGLDHLQGNLSTAGGNPLLAAGLYNRGTGIYNIIDALTTTPPAAVVIPLAPVTPPAETSPAPAASADLRYVRVGIHYHTDASDGSDSMRQMVDAAHAAGFDAIIITDHNVISAEVAACQDYARQLGMACIPGVEISTTEGEFNAIGIDPASYGQLPVWSDLATAVRWVHDHGGIAIANHPQIPGIADEQNKYIDAALIAATPFDYVECNQQRGDDGNGICSAQVFADAGLAKVFGSDAHSAAGLGQHGATAMVVALPEGSSPDQLQEAILNSLRSGQYADNNLLWRTGEPLPQVPAGISQAAPSPGQNQEFSQSCASQGFAEAYPGICYGKVQLDTGGTAYIIQANLDQPGVSFGVTPPGMIKTPRQYLEDTPGIVAVINGDFFRAGDFATSHLTVSQGQAYPGYDSGLDYRGACFLALEDGRMVLSPGDFGSLDQNNPATIAVRSELDSISLEDIEYATCGLPLNSPDGEVHPYAAQQSGNNYRTALAYNPDMRVLTLIAVDWPGASFEGLAKFVRSRGYGKGIMLDGGGSTQAGLRGASNQEGVPNLLNTPSPEWRLREASPETVDNLERPVGQIVYLRYSP